MSVDNKKSMFMDTLKDMGYQLESKEDGKWVFAKKSGIHRFVIIFNIVNKYISRMVIPGIISSEMQMKNLVEDFLVFKKDCEKLTKLSKYQLLE